MKKLIISIFILLATVSVAFSQAHNDGTPPKNSTWIKYSSPEGRYSVKMPAQPTLSTQESSSAEGVAFLQYLASAQSPESVCMIGYFDLTDTMKFDLDKARDGVVERLKATLLSDTAISLAEYAGKDLKLTAKAADGTEFLVRARIYVVQTRVYFVQFIVLGNTESPPLTAQAAEYFDSFSVTVP